MMNFLRILVRVCCIRGRVRGTLPVRTHVLTVRRAGLQLGLILKSRTGHRAFVSEQIASSSAALSLRLRNIPRRPATTHLTLAAILHHGNHILSTIASARRLLHRGLDTSLTPLLSRCATIRARLTARLCNNLKGRSPRGCHTEIRRLHRRTGHLRGRLSHHDTRFQIRARPIRVRTIRTLVPTSTTLIRLIRCQPFSPATGRARH